MDPEPTFDRVRQLYERWNAGDVDALADSMHDDVEYVNPDYAIEPGVRRGRDAVLHAMYGTLESAFDSVEHELHELIAAGEDRMLSLVTFRARGRDSQAEMEVAEQHLITLRDGRVVRIEWFHDEPAARRAAGLD